MADVTIAPVELRKPCERALPLYAAQIAGNVLAWSWAVAVFHGSPVLMGAAVLAYAFGLRHAVDADHIAAIDNVTRKLVSEGRAPLSVGLWFSLGHSTIVVLACAAIALGSAALETRFADFREAGNLLGTGISAAFLLFVALSNSAALFPLWREFRNRRAARAPFPAQLRPCGPQPGVMGRILRPLLRLVSRPRDMYLLGFLFGLGFDTASEIGLLGISASQASQNVPLWSIMVLPALFTAGMSLVDTTDGLVMAGAYGWAYADPARKLAYNLSVTFVSVAVALVVGGLETLGLFAARSHGWFWHGIRLANSHAAAMGCTIVAGMLSCWLLWVFVHRMPARQRLPWSRPATEHIPPTFLREEE